MKLDPGLDIGGLIFDRGNYDAENDVLYLDRGTAGYAYGEETDEGHAVRYSAEGEVIGVIVINAKWLLGRDGHLKITIPIPREVRIPPQELTRGFALVKAAA